MNGKHDQKEIVWNFLMKKHERGKKMKRYRKVLIGLVVVAMAIGASVVWAGHGYRDRGCDRGEGGFHGKGSGYGRMMDELSEADQERAKAAVDAFRESKRELRRTIHQKKLALEAEMAKSDPDANLASDLLKEIATLKTDAAQKWLDHRIEMKKIHPDLDRGFHRGGFDGKRGEGKGDCPKGFGSKQNDGQRDCPHGKRFRSRN